MKVIGQSKPDNLIAGPFPVKREGATIVAGQNLAYGSAVGRVKRALGTVDTSGLATGNGTLSDAAMGSKTKVGDYQVVCSEAIEDGGVFTVIDPDGVSLGQATVGTTYSNNHLTFNLAAGDTDFAAGDTFVVPVVAGSGKCKLLSSANVDGSGEIFGILYQDVDASEGDLPGVVCVTGDFNADAVVFGGTDTPETHRDAARNKGIFFNDAVANHP